MFCYCIYSECDSIASMYSTCMYPTMVSVGPLQAVSHIHHSFLFFAGFPPFQALTFSQLVILCLVNSLRQLCSVLLYCLLLYMCINVHVHVVDMPSTVHGMLLMLKCQFSTSRIYYQIAFSFCIIIIISLVVRC